MVFLRRTSRHHFDNYSAFVCFFFVLSPYPVNVMIVSVGGKISAIMASHADHPVTCCEPDDLTLESPKLNIQLQIQSSLCHISHVQMSHIFIGKR